MAGRRRSKNDLKVPERARRAMSQQHKLEHDQLEQDHQKARRELEARFELRRGDLYRRQMQEFLALRAKHGHQLGRGQIAIVEGSAPSCRR